MKVLATGANDFVGQALRCRLYEDKKHEVVAAVIGDVKSITGLRTAKWVTFSRPEGLWQPIHRAIRAPAWSRGPGPRSAQSAVGCPARCTRRGFWCCARRA